MEDQRSTAEKQPASTHTTINTTEGRRGGATLFIMGGLVVAVLGIGYFLFSNGTFGQASAPVSGGDVSISVETDGNSETAAPDVAPEAAAEPAPTVPAPPD